MGRSALLLMLVCVALVQEGAAASSDGRYLPVDMRFSDLEHGFVELQPVIACGSCPDRIQRTDDGGRTWRATSLRHIPLPAAERRFRASWSTGTRRGLQLAAVAGPSVAWATSQAEAGFGSRLFLSRDGGRSWKRVRLPCGRPFAFYRPLVAAVGGRRAWILCLGEPGAGQQNKALYETVDATRWTLRSNLSGSGYGQLLAFSNVGFGLLAESRGGLLVTRDRGRSWRMPRITSPEVAEPQAIAVFPPRWGLVLVRDDRSKRRIELYRTSDAGRRWSLLRVWE